MGATPCNVTGSMKRHASLRVGGGASVTRLNTVRTTVCTGPDIVPCPAGSTADADARYTEGSIFFSKTCSPEIRFSVFFLAYFVHLLGCQGGEY